MTLTYSSYGRKTLRCEFNCSTDWAVIKVPLLVGHNEAGRNRSIEKSNDPIGNRTRDLSACSILQQPTLPRRVLLGKLIVTVLSRHSLALIELGISLRVHRRTASTFHLCPTYCMHRKSHAPWFDHLDNRWTIQIIKLIIMKIYPNSCHFVSIFSSAPVFQPPQSMGIFIPDGETSHFTTTQNWRYYFDHSPGLSHRICSWNSIHIKRLTYAWIVRLWLFIVLQWAVEYIIYIF
jgi:hypothetical protein